MKKHEGMKKCTVLWGEVINKNNIELSKLDDLIVQARQKFDNVVEVVTQKIKTTKAPKQLEKLNGRIEREHGIYRRKLDRYLGRKQYWLTDPGKYSFDLQQVV